MGSNSDNLRISRFMRTDLEQTQWVSAPVQLHGRAPRRSSTEIGSAPCAGGSIMAISKRMHKVFMRIGSRLKWDIIGVVMPCIAYPKAKEELRARG
jgi:hypothetical protein